VIVHKEGINLETRFGTKRFLWKDQDQVLLTYRMDADNPSTELVLIPKDQNTKGLKLNLTDGICPIKARTYLIRDIGHRCVGFRKVDINSVDLSKHSTLNY